MRHHQRAKDYKSWGNRGQEGASHFLGPREERGAKSCPFTAANSQRVQQAQDITGHPRPSTACSDAFWERVREAIWDLAAEFRTCSWVALTHLNIFLTTAGKFLYQQQNKNETKHNKNHPGKELKGSPGVETRGHGMQNP